MILGIGNIVSQEFLEKNIRQFVLQFTIRVTLSVFGYPMSNPKLSYSKLYPHTWNNFIVFKIQSLPLYTYEFGAQVIQLVTK